MSSNHDIFASAGSKDNLRTTPQKQIFTSSMMKAPSSATFNFSHSSNGNVFDTSSNSNSNNKENIRELNITAKLSPRLNTNFYQEVELLRQRLYSTSLSNNVLSELDERYQKEKEKPNVLADHQDSLTSHTSYQPRYGPSHKSKFNKMESISSHYAARRKEQQKIVTANAANLRKKQTESRLVIEGNDNIETPSKYDEMSKRSAMKELSSSKKRMRKLDGTFKEINDSPTNKQSFTLLTAESKLTTTSSLYDNYENKAPVLNPSLLPPPPQPQFEPTKTTKNTLKKSSFSSHSLQKSSACNNLHNILESNKNTLKKTSSSIPALSRRTPSNSENEKPSVLSSFSSKPSCIPQPRLSKSGMVRSTTMQDVSPTRLNSVANLSSVKNSKLKPSLLNPSAKENYPFGKSTILASTAKISRSATSSNIPRLSSSNLSTNQNSKLQARPAWRV